MSLIFQGLKHRNAQKELSSISGEKNAKKEHEKTFLLNNSFINLYHVIEYIGSRTFWFTLRIGSNTIIFLKKVIYFVICCLKVLKRGLNAFIDQIINIGQNFFTLWESACKFMGNKITSTYFAHMRIQSTIAFLMNGLAIAAFCCLAGLLLYKTFLLHKIFSPTPPTSNQTNTHTPQPQIHTSSISQHSAKSLTSKETAVPRRKLKHLLKDPLILKQEQVREALVAFHIDAIQRYENGMEKIIMNNQSFSTGAILQEHPKIHLTKIGKNSLYFSDKYGQQYKRSIERMLE